MFWASLCSLSGKQGCLIPHVVMPGCAGCGRVELGRKHSNNSFHALRTACVPAPHDHSQHDRASPHAVLNILVLLTMGLMMPETC